MGTDADTTSGFASGKLRVARTGTIVTVGTFGDPPVFKNSGLYASTGSNIHIPVHLRPYGAPVYNTNSTGMIASQSWEARVDTGGSFRIRTDQSVTELPLHLSVTYAIPRLIYFHHDAVTGSDFEPALFVDNAPSGTILAWYPGGEAPTPPYNSKQITAPVAFNEGELLAFQDSAFNEYLTGWSMDSGLGYLGVLSYDQSHDVNGMVQQQSGMVLRDASGAVVYRGISWPNVQSAIHDADDIEGYTLEWFPLVMVVQSSTLPEYAFGTYYPGFDVSYNGEELAYRVPVYKFHLSYSKTA